MGAWWFCFINTSRWIGFRLDTIAAIMLTAGALLAMSIHSKVDTCRAQGPDVLYAVMVMAEWQVSEAFPALWLCSVLMLCPTSKACTMSSCSDILDVAQVSPRLVGLALAQVLSLSGTMQW